MRRDAIRLSYSQIQRLRRCPWAWHARHVRKLVPLRRKRPPPAWGDAYHAAAAMVWIRRAVYEREGRDWTVDADHGQDEGRKAARERLVELDVPGLDPDAVSAECAQAAVEACRSVGPEWRVLWLDGEPVVERRLVTPIGEVDCERCDGAHMPETCTACGGTGKVHVELVTILDLALVHDDGRVRVVDHKTTTSWPEQVGDALKPDEDLALDLADDLQVRLYVLALTYALAEAGHLAVRAPGSLAFSRVEGGHLVRRATCGKEPHRTRDGHGPLTRAAEHEATVEQWEMAIRRHHFRREDYEQQLARARLMRWQAWAPCEFTAASLDLARREALAAAADIARFGAMTEDEIAPHRVRQTDRWSPLRQGKWTGLQPATPASTFTWSSCQACDWRDLCTAEGQGRDVALMLESDYAHAEDLKAEREAGEPPPCDLDADEV